LDFSTIIYKEGGIMSFEKTSFRQSIEFNIINLSRGVIVTLLGLCYVFMISGCGIFGESDYERRQREEKQRAEIRENKQKAQIQELENRFDAFSYPAELHSSSDYTYLFQQFFKNTKNKNLIFKASVNDVWQEKDSLYVEFLCPLGTLSELQVALGLVGEDGIILRLTASQNDALYIANEEDRAILEDEYLFLPMKQQVLVVATISEVKREKLYQHSAYGYGADAEVELETLKNVIAYGRLVAYQQYETEMEP
jgi:hypothetical protein